MQWLSFLPAIILAIVGIASLFVNSRGNELTAEKNATDQKLATNQISKIQSDIESAQLTNVTEASRFVMDLFTAVKTELEEANKQIAHLKHMLQDQAAAYEARLAEQERRYEAKIAEIKRLLLDKSSQNRTVTPKRNTKPRRPRAPQKGKKV